MKRAVFLDRDGVINQVLLRNGKPHPPGGPGALQILDGVPDALRRLRGAGFLLIVVTNQPDVARGTATRESIEQMHRRLLDELALDYVYTCYHDGNDCECRKPKPGALLRAAQEHSIDLQDSFMVGDRWRDIEAGQRAGCECLFIDYGYNERRPSPPYTRVESLSEAAALILGSKRD
jgi:D-glycero-D-manno-heptose 1,7-bisphosphate phosphatase